MSDSSMIEDLEVKLKARDESHFVAAQLLELYYTARKFQGGTFLELGTDRGQGTNAILASCDAIGGRLVSVDILDCSTAASSPNWTFVQASSVDREGILAKAPWLKDGIDMMYIDSLHTPEHVQNEIYTWFDLVREDGSIFFDDVDSGPYMAGRRKDNPRIEIANRQIRELLERVFYGNVDKVELSLFYGSTGLALLTKRAPFGTSLAPLGRPVAPRRSYMFAKVRARIGAVGYTHRRDGSDMI